MTKKQLPTYQVVWDRFQGHYVASSSSLAGITVVKDEAMPALDEIQYMVALLN